MTEEFVRDFYGIKIGILRTENDGNITVLSFPGRVPLGQYVVKYNHTIELPSRLIVSQGNTTIQFLYRNKK